MSEYLGLSSRPTPPTDRPRSREEFPSPAARLTPCPDCNHSCSTQAEHCPQCGRYFRRYATLGEVEVSKKGWASTIASGIVLGWVLIGILSVALFVVLFILGVGLSMPRR